MEGVLGLGWALLSLSEKRCKETTNFLNKNVKMDEFYNIFGEISLFWVKIDYIW